jgi:uncharacterized protein
LPITAFYSGFLSLLFLVLSVRVIRQRRRARIGLGDGGDLVVLRRIRVHSNFAEYVPLALLLMALVESVHGSSWLLHSAGAVLVVARCVHAWGVSRTPEDYRLRVVGMGGTLTVIGILACVAIVSYAVR